MNRASLTSGNPPSAAQRSKCSILTNWRWDFFGHVRETSDDRDQDFSGCKNCHLGGAVLLLADSGTQGAGHDRCRRRVLSRYFVFVFARKLAFAGQRLLEPGLSLSFGAVGEGLASRPICRIARCQLVRGCQLG